LIELGGEYIQAPIGPSSLMKVPGCGRGECGS